MTNPHLIKRANARASRLWTRVGTRFLPFADAATTELPLARLLRLALFQVSVGMAYALMVGTLNRVMVVELGMSTALVALMVALPLLAAPFRALMGFRSDTHRSALGWRRVPYLWLGTLLQFGGLSIMPFALILMAPGANPAIHIPGLGAAAAALAFVLVGFGMQTTQTAGLALATDQAREDKRPRVVALMYLMLLLGMVAASVLFSLVLTEFSNTRLVGVVQGAAVLTVLFNALALWKQEPRGTVHPEAQAEPFRSAWASFSGQPRTRRFLVAVALGTAAFNMQDIVLEPYGGAILQLSVAATSLLTAVMALGSVAAFALAARLLQQGSDPYRLAAVGSLIGVVAFAAVIFAAPLNSAALFRVGILLIGLGFGLFAVSTLVVAMSLDNAGRAGLALGAWGAVQAGCGGLGLALGGSLRDLMAYLAHIGWLGEAMSQAWVPYSLVYHLEIALLFGTLIALGPLVRPLSAPRTPRQSFGMPQFPG
ncbi:MAG: BCD family MFS transporter [Ideonella sp.]|nr:BCD family MFS transporter [Ideonella sp.]